MCHLFRLSYPLIISANPLTFAHSLSQPAVMAVVPASAQTNHKVRQLKEILDEVRTQCNDVEVSLATALEPEQSAYDSMDVMSEARKSAAQLQRESKRLLAEVRIGSFVFWPPFTCWCEFSSQLACTLTRTIIIVA